MPIAAKFAWVEESDGWMDEEDGIWEVERRAEKDNVVGSRRTRSEVMQGEEERKESLTLAGGQLVVLPCSGAGVHGPVGDGYQASGARSPKYFQLHHAHALTHLLTGGLEDRQLFDYLRIAVTCVVVIVDGDRGRVVVAQHGFGGDAVIQRGGANLRVANQPRVAEVDVEILVFLEDVVVNHSDCDL
ncbi:hypothetical protein EYF80_049803 [Liparis tanakae]|uniref:Uncharacterized protein n=1 Tax=Liparis tanakae TaxID=230148 RepID=A0A4Z2FGG2_9TELE|nr:hypothetical protein EYF80_049803 [Liparis tanakae]